MACPKCKGQVAWPSEVRSGHVVGICPFCSFRYDAAAPPPRPSRPDQRGRPSKPGG